MPTKLDPYLAYLESDGNLVAEIAFNSGGKFASKDSMALIRWCTSGHRRRDSRKKAAPKH